MQPVRHLPPARSASAHLRAASAWFPGGPAKPPGQNGASLIEFTVAAVPILLLGLGGIETAQWLLARQAVSLALLEAGRAGIVAHARPADIASAFEQALLPLFPASDSAGARRKQQAAFRRRRLDTGAAPWQITILSPTPEAFDDFADPLLDSPAHGGLPAINNHYQLEQDQRRRAQGWPGGRGPASGASIYQANTLTLRLSYLHEPVVPGMKGLLRLLGTPYGSYSQHAMARGYLPLSREISLAMQSHPVRWPASGDGAIVRPGPPVASGPPAVPAGSCAGLWCASRGGPMAKKGPHAAQACACLLPPKGAFLPWGGPAAKKPQPAYPPAVDIAQYDDAAPGAPPQPDSPDAAAPGPEPGGLAVSPEDPACGLTLCCVPA